MHNFKFWAGRSSFLVKTRQFFYINNPLILCHHGVAWKGWYKYFERGFKISVLPVLALKSHGKNSHVPWPLCDFVKSLVVEEMFAFFFSFCRYVVGVKNFPFPFYSVVLFSTFFLLLYFFFLCTQEWYPKWERT